MAVSFEDLLQIVGVKEAQIFDLSRENNKLRSELQTLAKSLQPATPPAPPAHVIPFPTPE